MTVQKKFLINREMNIMQKRKIGRKSSKQVTW